jgi:hypothetical protein
MNLLFLRKNARSLVGERNMLYQGRVTEYQPITDK